MLAEHSIVVLNSDMPDVGLHAGDVGAIGPGEMLHTRRRDLADQSVVWER